MDGVRTGSGLHEYPEIYKNRYLRVRNKIFLWESTAGLPILQIPRYSYHLTT